MAAWKQRMCNNVSCGELWKLHSLGEKTRAVKNNTIPSSVWFYSLLSMLFLKVLEANVYWSCTKIILVIIAGIFIINLILNRELNQDRNLETQQSLASRKCWFVECDHITSRSDHMASCCEKISFTFSLTHSSHNHIAYMRTSIAWPQMILVSHHYVKRLVLIKTHWCIRFVPTARLLWQLNETVYALQEKVRMVEWGDLMTVGLLYFSAVVYLL